MVMDFFSLCRIFDVMSPHHCSEFGGEIEEFLRG
jgi:hypothetical protein